MFHNRFLNLVVLLVSLNTWAFGQTTNHFPDSGNVGIGTTSPYGLHSYSVLDIIGKSSANGGYIRFSTSNSSGEARILSSNDRLAFDLQKAGMYFQWRNSDSKEIHRLNSDGTAIWNGFESSSTKISSNTGGQYIAQFNNDGVTRSWLIRGYGSNGVQAEFNDGGINVNGTIKTKEVNVTASGWADHVFKPGYNLMPLSELEAFIQKNGHLPAVPTEANVLKDGVNLAEMNVKLLEKVEELTLHLISQENKISAQEKYIEGVLKRMEMLETKQNK